MLSVSSRLRNLFCSSSPNVPPLAIFLPLFCLGDSARDTELSYQDLMASSNAMILIS